MGPGAPTCDLIIERIARYIRRASHIDHEFPDRDSPDIPGHVENMWDRRTDEARELLDIVREPTENMETAGVLPAMSRDSARTWAGDDRCSGSGGGAMTTFEQMQQRVEEAHAKGWRIISWKLSSREASAVEAEAFQAGALSDQTLLGAPYEIVKEADHPALIFDFISETAPDPR